MLCLGTALAQQPAPRPTEPGTGSAQVAPASKAPAPVQQPDVRLDSKPHTDLDYTLDSSPEPMDLGLGSNANIDLGHDIVATTPPGMVAHSIQDNPRMVYFSLPGLAAGEVSAADRSILAARQGDLNSAAARHKADLQAGWSYRQSICPAAQPDAQALVGVPAAGDGAILLRFTREDSGRVLTAVVPRNSAAPVRVVVVPDRRRKDGREIKSAKRDRAAVNDLLPPETLYSNLEPVQSWIAASACVAEVEGASPSIPNEPFLSEDILTAPPPLLRLLLNGERKIVFTDRIGENRYAIWDEHVSHVGRMLDTEHEVLKIEARPVTNPPVPPTHMIANLPEPPSHVGPEPPSPLAGTKQ